MKYLQCKTVDIIPSFQIGISSVKIWFKLDKKKFHKNVKHNNCQSFELI